MYHGSNLAELRDRLDMCPMSRTEHRANRPSVNTNDLCGICNVPIKFHDETEVCNYTQTIVREQHALVDPNYNIGYNMQHPCFNCYHNASKHTTDEREDDRKAEQRERSHQYDRERYEQRKQPNATERKQRGEGESHGAYFFSLAQQLFSYYTACASLLLIRSLDYTSPNSAP